MSKKSYPYTSPYADRGNLFIQGVTDIRNKLLPHAEFKPERYRHRLLGNVVGVLVYDNLIGVYRTSVRWGSNG